MSATCIGCDALIFWALSQQGKKMPMDSTPSATGTFQLEDRPGDNPVAMFVREEERADKRLYACHFATCKNVKARVMRPLAIPKS